MGALLKKGEEDIPLALGSSACVISSPVVRQGTEIGGEMASRARAKIFIRGASILIRIKVTINLFNRKSDNVFYWGSLLTGYGLGNISLTPTRPRPTTPPAAVKLPSE